jgi:transposase
MEAMRCLKRRISDAVYRQLIADAEAAAISAENEQADQTATGVGTGPGGHCGASHESSAVDLPPHIDTSDQPLPGPANATLQPDKRPWKTTTKRRLNRAG